MSLTQERINEIALECFEKRRYSTKPEYIAYYDISEPELKEAINTFLSRIREEQEAVGRFIEYPNGWREVSKNNEFYELAEPLFTIPPASHDCKELVEALEELLDDDEIADILGSAAYHRIFGVLSKHKAIMGEK